MKRFFFPFLLLCVCLPFVACSDDDEAKDEVVKMKMMVSSQTDVMYGPFDSEQLHPFECMLVSSPESTGQWVKMPFGQIEGFNYVKGHAYELLVERTKLANPPADASCYRYKLLSIVSDKVEQAGPNHEAFDVTSEADIPWAEGCPAEIYRLFSTALEVDKDSNIRVSDINGNTMNCDYTKGAITFEYTLKAGDNFYNNLDYLQGSYYLLSPLSAKIVNHVTVADGIPLPDLITKDEFDYITKQMKVGDTLTYSFILANGKGYGLQKLSFVVKKV